MFKVAYGWIKESQRQIPYEEKMWKEIEEFFTERFNMTKTTDSIRIKRGTFQKYAFLWIYCRTSV